MPKQKRPQKTAGEEEKGRSILPWVLLALAAIVTILILTAPWKSQAGPVAESSAPGSTDKQTASHGTPIQTGDPAKPVELQTPVGVLRFPDEFAGEVELSETTQNGVYSAVVDGFVGETRVRLFKVLVGEELPAYLVGYVPNEQGELLPVGLDISEIPTDPSWSEAQTKRINLLQGCVNDLIEQINLLPGYQGLN